MIFNNYWTRLSKISWPVSGEQINYLPKPKADENNWSARQWPITIFAITEFNNCFIIRSPSLFFNEYPREAKLTAIFTQERSQEGEKQGFFYAWAEYYLKPNKSQTQLKAISHEQTIVRRKLLEGHVVGSWPMKGKKNLLRMIISL